MSCDTEPVLQELLYRSCYTGVVRVRYHPTPPHPIPPHPPLPGVTGRHQ
jgi:hypothetical protein